MNILVTGIAGDIGNAIGRILRNSEYTRNLIGCDIHNQHGGNLVFDYCESVPRAESETYIEAIGKITQRHNIDAIFATSEPELRYLFNNKIADSIFDVPIIMANYQSMRIGFDKLATANFLRDKKLPYPWTSIVGEEQPHELPCILKNRFGAGGHDVKIINDSRLIAAVQDMYPDYIWQELVGNSDEEYTCGVYRSKLGDTRTIAFRRRLNAGITSYGTVTENGNIDAICARVANELQLIGSINIQLRLTNKGPIVFEINPRFSSTVGFRHKLGFQDVIWSLLETLGKTLPPYESRPAHGTRIVRVFDEIIFNPDLI